jgi:hypothetical protein
VTIYLYVKTHNKTGLKYLGKTTMTDPHAYKGSGADWKNHLKEYGEDYTTEIIRECQTNKELNEWGRYYSNLWNVAESDQWANRIPETGGGANHTSERKELFRQQQLGKKKPPRTPEHAEKIASQIRGKPNKKTSAGLKKWYNSNPDRSAAIKQQSMSLKEWYKNNPDLSHQKSLKSWDSRYRKQYNEYKRAVELIMQGHGAKIIQEETGMCLKPESIEKLKSGKHRIYDLFPDLNKILVV